MVYAEPFSSSHDWRDPGHELYYPTCNAAAPQATSLPLGRSWNSKVFTESLANFTKRLPDPSKSVPVKKGKKSTTDQPAAKQMVPKYTPRKALSNPSPDGTSPQTVLANHFELHVDAKDLYEYEILDLEGEGRTRKKVQALFRRTLDAWTHLSTNKDSFATDNHKIIVSWKNLHENLTTQPEQAGQGDDQEEAVWPAENITTGNHPTQARFKFVRKVKVARLLQQTLASIDEMVSDLSAVERCLNILISKSFDQNVLRLSANKFFVKGARKALQFNEDGVKVDCQTLEIMRGYYYAIKPGMGSLLMNFNVATSAFFRPILVSEFLQDRRTFVDYGARVSILCRLRVYVDPTHTDERFRKLGARIKTINSIGDDNIENLFFFKKLRDADQNLLQVNGVQQYTAKATYVTEHLKEVFKLKEIVTGRPAVNCGTAEDPVWYAQELLRIVPYQLYTRPVPDNLTGSMVEQAALHPAGSQRLIETEGLRQLGFSGVKNEKVKFRNGVPLSLYPTMMRIDCARLPFPEVQYKFSSKVKDEKISMKDPRTGLPQPRKGSAWNIPDNQCFHVTPAKELKYYLIQALDGPFNSTTTHRYVDLFEEELKNQMKRRCNVDPSFVVRVNLGIDETSLKTTTLDAHLAAARTAKAHLVVFMLPSPDRFNYGDYKRLADRKYGLRSICLAKPSQLDSQIGKYMSNIVQKVNFKSGGINAQVNGIAALLGNKRTLVLGADVVHPGHLAFEESPSIACIVGSVDDEAGRFFGSARLQSKDKKDREIIDHAQEMVQERINAWMTANSTSEVPANIIYYRDGVSEGQYASVVAVELSAIRRAWVAVKEQKQAKVGGPPKMSFPGQKTQTAVNLTAIVGGKRHHTRFYPMEKADQDDRGNANCKPGTYVDRVVTSPYYDDFYLQSHSGIKGTARPTHYFPLVVGNIDTCKTIAQIRKLTHFLCYAYCRTAGGVSYATPTYYADRLCDRARLYLDKTWSGNDTTFAAALAKAKDDKQKELQKVRDDAHRGGQPLQEGDVKSQAELDDEAQDPERIRVCARETVLDFAKKEFYDRTEDLNGNPWHDDLEKVMFWM